MANKGTRAIRALGSCYGAPQPPVDVPGRGGPGTSSAAAQRGLGEAVAARGWCMCTGNGPHSWPEMAIRASINRHGSRSKNQKPRQRLKRPNIISNISEAHALTPNNHGEQAVRVLAVWSWPDMHVISEVVVAAQNSRHPRRLFSMAIWSWHLSLRYVGYRVKGAGTACFFGNEIRLYL